MTERPTPPVRPARPEDDERPGAASTPNGPPTD